mmetsp:Transcript_19335/g.27902  ORF Transcript_19335/g.27902 Transcript_19335/m.27902 type:complete len:160 (+) Transcript_19335:812-1291(+)
MSRAKGARVCIVGSITGNSNTVGGGLVYPRADLGKLQGFGKTSTPMADGKGFFGAKAYKDSKVCNMMTVSELHERYHESTGIVFSSMYPGCIAETNLFREKRGWFRKVSEMERVTQRSNRGHCFLYIFPLFVGRYRSTTTLIYISYTSFLSYARPSLGS